MAQAAYWSPVAVMTPPKVHSFFHAQVPAIRLPDAPLIEAAEHQSEHESLPSMPSPSKRRKLDAGLGSTKSAIHVGVALPSPERGREIDARWLAETGITRPMQSLNTQSGLEPAGHDALRSRNDDDEDPREAADAPRRNITKQMRLDGKGGMSLPPAPIMLLSRKVGKVVDQRLMRPRPGKRKCTVAAIRYGVEDDVVRERIMNCINAIFAIPPNPSGTHLEAPLSTLIKSVPPICSKPHHPFFTEQRGANKHKTLKDVGDVAMNRTPPPPIASPTCGIFRSFATPKRMRLKTSEENAQSPPMRRLDTFRLPGTHEPLWPCGELFQVGRRGIRSQDVAAYNLSSARNTSRKLKYKTMAVAPTENILRIQMQSVTAANNTNISKNIEIPQRMVMSGLQLRSILGPDLRYRYNRDGFMSTPNDPRHQDLLKPNKPPAHAALQHLYKQLPHILGPFDRTESEMLTWTQKYAPKSAEAVLQIGKDMHVLRSWLEGLTVNSIERQSKDQTTKLEEKIARKKKRKTRSELGDFIVESDDDLTSMLDLNDAQGENKHATLDSSRSVIRDATENTKDTKNPNIVLLSGPSGCGKTAAVYAVAKELGFDVFELNAGSRRSRKDVLDRVGDMTQNHLVHQPDQKPSRLEALQCDKSIAESTPDDKQRSLQSFFGKVGPKVRKNLTSTMDISEGRAKSRDTKNLKQSLILLEEVDILFEEDKQFWETVLALASQSKRPIIMTCNDETSVPLQLFSLHAILRFRRPPQDLAVEYLRLIAACEGHLLKRQPVELLYSSTNQDFRASLSQLNFWCQMGLGDRKGGFEWLLKRWPKGCDVGVDGRKLRVISAGTYKEDQGQHNDLTDITGIRDPRFAEDNATQLWSQQHICPADLTENKSTAIFASWGLSQAESDTVNNCLMGLNSLAIISDAQSAADIFCKTDMPSMDMLHELIDCTQPPLSVASRANYIDVLPLLDAKPIEDQTQLDTAFAIELQRCVGKYMDGLVEPGVKHRPTSTQDSVTAPTKYLSRRDFAAALDPIAFDVGPSNGAPCSLQSTSFDREFRVIAEDLAPYIRAIAAFDLALERQRDLIHAALSGEGRNAKRARTTRASRSALEGSLRSSTRRERWFNDVLDLGQVMRTGGEDWPQPPSGFAQACESDRLCRTSSRESSL